MPGKIDIINAEPLLHQLEEVNAGRLHFAQLSSHHFRMLEYKTRPLQGFTFRPGFPHCCDPHKSWLNAALDHFAKFPECCEHHKSLLSAPWFRKADYAYFPIKFLLTCAYTDHCISISIDLPDWYKRITDYIDYTKESYGQMPYGFGAPLGAGMYEWYVKRYIQTSHTIPTDKRAPLLSFFKLNQDACSLEEQVDINALVTLYKEWLSIFPFQISFFKELKSFFEGRMPVLKSGPDETNMYTGLTKKKLISVKEMIEFLTATTKTILKEINTLRLHKHDLLDDADAVSLEIITAKRELDLKKYEATSAGSQSYQLLLAEWLKDEKAFLDEITPLLRKGDQRKNFIGDMVDGIKMLQALDHNADCIVRVREDLPDKESSFRYAFYQFFRGRYANAVISAEEQKGDGQIDLKISSAALGEKIIEFKGWWNSDKKHLAEQICRYLTDAHKEGYIVMINPNRKKSIESEYRDLIMAPEMHCLSWQAHNIHDTDIRYYESRHQFGIYSKTLYHFLFNVYFSAQASKA